ncbi:hypothetical protein [Candidatus Similichlamydia epinepheli]|uniref:hypothetical protein n=1 Tax=Candidatus Similichlamydia epinepheli TaxID=1903953 RepID=UPI000D37903C|nr:hypothetical protein [Candidatus Similichlamydia epinepheli]
MTRPHQVLILFGSTGSLAREKIFPALYQLEKLGLLGDDFLCIGVGRQEITSLELLERSSVVEHAGSTTWNKLVSKLRYCKLQIDDLSTYVSLQQVLEELGKQADLSFFLAVSTKFFFDIVSCLIKSSCWRPERSSLFLEKPFGHDFKSSLELQKQLDELVNSDSIHLIDHYLCKPGVGSLLEIRCLPSISRLWNSTNIQSIHVIATESIGINQRANFFNQQGQVKDMIQSHLLQVLSLGCISMSEEVSIRERKENFLSSLRFSTKCPIQIGQYSNGEIDGVQVCSYLQEKDITNESKTETFAAMRFTSVLPEWKDVDFELFTGKRLNNKRTEVIVLFRSGERMIIQSEPEIKIVGFPKEVNDIRIEIEKEWKSRLFGYEAILKACLYKEGASFLSATEASLGWKSLENYFLSPGEHQLQIYRAGSWGPTAALQVYTTIHKHLQEKESEAKQ